MGFLLQTLFSMPTVFISNRTNSPTEFICRAVCCFIDAQSIISASAAAEENEESYDDKPDPLVVKKIAKTVIHIMSSINV